MSEQRQSVVQYGRGEREDAVRNAGTLVVQTYKGRHILRIVVFILSYFLEPRLRTSCLKTI